MRVIQLNHHLVWKIVPVVVHEAKAVNDVVQRAGHEEVLLLQSQLLSLQCVVIRVQYFADVL